MCISARWKICSLLPLRDSRRSAWPQPFDPRQQAVSTMNWLHLVSYFFGGCFLSNAVPHFVSGVMGRAFQSPFAKPSGQGLSSSTVNVLWGVFNFAVAYVLICRVGEFSLRSTAQVAALGGGFLLMGLMAAHHFGRFHGGRSSGIPA